VSKLEQTRGNSKVESYLQTQTRSKHQHHKSTTVKISTISTDK